MEELNMKTLLNIENLSIQTQERTIIKNVSFSINSGEAILLSGANGIGKSTLLKSFLCLETEGKKIAGVINHHEYGDILSLKGEALQRYRSSIAYVQQRDEYAEMGNIQVRDIISESKEAHSQHSLSYAEVNELIDEWIPRKSDNSRIFDAKSKPSKFSGGEQRLLSVLSIIATRSEADLIIIDEPLNNLDFENARNISNLINKVIKNNRTSGLLMISHCRIFPFINREIRLTSNGIETLNEHYSCHSCFGEPDANGYY